jgi:putative hydroxymethylpyrimidine transport system permease protein
MLRRAVAPALVLATALLLWEVGVRAIGVPGYILPPPSRILLTFIERFPLLARNGLVTSAEILLGLLFGGGGGFLLAVALYHSRTLERGLYPLIIASQMIPVFAIAPLLIVWLGYGLWPKVAVAGLIGFFPIVVNEVDGLRSASGEMVDLFRSLGATRRQVFVHLLFPASLPSLFSGLKLAATLSVVGATIGEWVGAREGLGYLMLQSNARLRVDVVFAAILTLTLVGLLLFAAFRIIERRVLRWWDSAVDRSG